MNFKKYNKKLFFKILKKRKTILILLNIPYLNFLQIKFKKFKKLY